MTNYLKQRGIDMASKKINKLVKSARIELGQSQEWLAAKMGVSQPLVSQWEAGTGTSAHQILGSLFMLNVQNIDDGEADA